MPHVNGGVGVTRRLGQGPLAYGLTTLRLEYNHGFADRLQPAAGLRGGLLFDVGRVTFDWSASSARLANGQTRTHVDLRHNLKLARHHALHLEWRWQDQQPEAVQAVLRHASYETTKRHYAPGDVQKQAGVLRMYLGTVGANQRRRNPQVSP